MKPAVLLFIAALVAPQARAEPPSLPAAEALVRAQYGPLADGSPEGAARLYEPALARALVDSGAANGGDLGFDPRYGDTDWKVQSLTLSTAAAPGGAMVAARFENFGKSVEIDWRLTDSPDGWRVSDISAPPQNDQPAWDLRQLLQLKPVP